MTLLPTLDISLAAFGPNLDRLSRALDQPVAHVLRERCGFFATYLADATYPLSVRAQLTPEEVAAGRTKGKKLGGQKIGKLALKRDVERVYIPIAAVLAELKAKHPKAARVLARLVKKGDFAAANRVIAEAGAQVRTYRGGPIEVVPWDGGALHEAKRGSRGKVAESVKPVVVDDGRQLKAYIRARQQKVGFAKSGWIKAMRSLGIAVSAEPWLAQPAPGSGIDRSLDPVRPFVQLANRVSYIGRAFNDDQYVRAQKVFAESLAKRLAHELAAVIKKQNRFAAGGGIYPPR